MQTCLSQGVVSPIFENLKVFVHLVDAKGTVWAQHDDLAGGIQHPTGAWHGGDFVEQEFPLTLPTSAPEGTYRIEVGAYRPATLQRLKLTDATAWGADAVTLDTEVINAAEVP